MFLGGGLLAKFGDALADQSYNARFEDGAEAAFAVRAPPKGAANHRHTARNATTAAIDLVPCKLTSDTVPHLIAPARSSDAGGFSRVRRATATPFNLVLEARP
jgi:hypothetical protein